MNFLITGGCGYIGSVLVPLILKEKKCKKITVIDTQWFGNYLKKNKKLIIQKKNIANIKKNDLKHIDVVIHLANIANDPSAELSPELSIDTNIISTINLFNFAKKNKVKKFIFASSGSVYGIKKEKKVTEKLSLVPISIYNKTKMIAENLIMSNLNDTTKVYIIRPATVCGYSPRLRLDVSVNMLTFQALKNKKITVLGGKQIRPNLHIKDMARVYLHFIKKNQIKSGIYNAGFENLSILKLAKIIKKKINCSIQVKSSNDPRSYRLDSSKLLKTGFKPGYTVKMAIEELVKKYKQKKISETDKNYTVKWMKKIKV